MKFISTRNNAGEVTFKEAVFTGLAPDGGLYYPKEQPDLRSLFQGFNRNTDFKRLAGEVAASLLSDEIDRSAACRITENAFTFSPVLRALDGNISLLELFHGPTCAFKDFGAAFLASAMEEFLAEEKRRAVILVATSGDTGSAVAQAFLGKKNIEVVILYPSGRVSELQEKQLTTLGRNVCALEVKGSFDDCQRLAKEAFMNKELKTVLHLTSANSINPGRLIPQSFYYIYALAQLEDDADDLCICVPSGNFGNLTAGVYAWQWGLPVKRFLAATNINDVVPEYLQTGLFKPRASKKTFSNAMDVGNPSNFERLLAVFNKNYKSMGKLIHGETVTDSETLEMMQKIFREKKILIDPHTAVGITAATRYQKYLSDKSRVIVLATAHPGKFSSIVEQGTGLRPDLPESLKEADSSTKQSIVIGNTFEELSDLLMEKYM